MATCPRQPSHVRHSPTDSASGMRLVSRMMKKGSSELSVPWVLVPTSSVSGTTYWSPTKATCHEASLEIYTG